MFSKRALHGWLTGFVVAATVATVSCTPKIGEDPPDQTQQELGGTECLSQATATIREYFRGDATNDAVEDGWVCLGVAFEKFNKYVRGKNQSYFTPQELADFFEQNFMTHDVAGKPVTKIGPELQVEIMKFKQIFLGGSRENVTREEVMHAARLFVDLKRITVHLNPYMKILVQKWKPQNLTILSYRADVDFFRAANLEVQAAAKDLSLLIQAQHDPYKLDDAVSFLREISKFYNEDDGMVDQVRKFLPVVKKIKIALAGGSEEDVRPGEWRRMLLLGGRGYMQYLRYKYFIQGPINAGKGLQLSYVADTFEDALSIFEDLVREKPSGLVSRDEMNEIMTAFAGAWPEFHYSEKLGSEIMKVKQVFIGGERESWSVRDFENARLKVKALRVIFERVLPYFDIYASEWNPAKLDPEDAQQTFADATDALAQSAQELGATLESSYSVADARSFLKEWVRLYPPPPPPAQGIDQKIEPYLPVVKNLKNTVFSDSDDVIRKDQWPMFLKVSGQAYMVYLRYDYFLKDIPADDTMAKVSPVAATIDDAVAMLSGIAAAKPNGKITLPEMNKVLSSLSSIWQGLPYSDKLGAEIMKLKQALVGGTNDSWTVADFNQLQSKAKTVVAVARLVIPHFDVYTGKWDPSTLDPAKAEQVFNDAKSALDSAAKSAGQLFAGDYSLRDLKALLAEFTRLSPPAKPDDGLDKVLEKYGPLIQKAKNLAFDDSDDVFHPAQWPVLLSLGAEGFSDVRYYGYFLGGEWNDSALVARFGRFIDTALAFANKILDTKPSHALTAVEFRGVFEAIQKAGMLTSLTLKAETVEAVYNVVLNRVLQSPEDRLAGKAPAALTKASLAYARSQFFVWVLTQQFLLDTMNAAPGKELTAAELLAKIADVRNSGSASPMLVEGITEVSKLIDAKVLLTLDAGGRAVISGRLAPKINLKTVKMENLVRSIGRAMMFAYVDDIERIKDFRGALLTEAQNGFQELRALGVDIGLLAPNNTTFVDSRFREANIFVPHSNGDNLASFSEIGDLVTMIMSGLKIDSQLRPSLVRDCSAVAEPKQTDTVDFDCLYANYKKQFPAVMTALPEFQKYQKTQDESTFNFFFYNSLKAAGYVPNLSNKVKFEDVGLLPHLIQYVELLNARFDINHDDAIDVGEADLAFPAFRSLFKELAKKELESGLIKEEELFALFTFVLYYGKPPGLSDLLRWSSWKKTPSKWEAVYADRTQMAKILGYVADQLAKPQPTSVPRNWSDDSYMDRAGFGG